MTLFRIFLAFQVVLVFSLPSYAAEAKLGFIDTPDVCYGVSQVKGTQVQLEPKGKCEGKAAGRAFLQTSESEVEVYIGDAFIGKRRVQKMAVQDIGSALDKSEAIAGQMVLPKNPFEQEMAKKAEQANDLYRSEEYQKKIQDEIKRIQAGMLAQDDAAQVQYPDAGASSVAGYLQPDERIYLFVSASMPLETLRAYASTVEKIGDGKVSIVLRGFVGGMKKVQPTVQFIGDVLKKTVQCTAEDCEFRKAGVVIDPLLYRRYGINRVPAVVYAHGLDLVDPKQSEGKDDNVKTGEARVVYGDANLEYIISLIQRDTQSTSLRALLDRIGYRR